jgi:hypothetical protein
VLTSFGERALSAASQAGMVNNPSDGLAWGIFPLLFARHGLPVSRIGVLAALPGRVGVGQLATGGPVGPGRAQVADRGRRQLLALGRPGRRCWDRRRPGRPGRRDLAGAALTGLSGVVVAVRMYETHRPAARP